MGRIPEETIQRIIDANDIVDVIMEDLPDLKRAGSNSFKACCPFHMEKTPSFTVSPSRQNFKCFGCGESGSVIGYYMKRRNLPFGDALRQLASRANITIVEEEESASQVAERKGRMRIIELHNDFSKFMHELLLKDPKATHAREYLKSRGFGSEMAKNWLVGWHPEHPDQVIEWAKSKGYKAKELVEAGLANANDDPSRGLYYRFRDRLMFPINNDYGDVVAFSGRQLREDPRSGKYINSPETLIFKKSKIFFGLHKARQVVPKHGYAMICEGQMDVIACHEKGFPYTIASLGTAFTPEHAQILKRYTKNVLLCFDSDNAGQKATKAAFSELVKVGLTIKVVTMPKGEDPDSYMQKHGTEAFQSLVNDAREFFDYKIRYEAESRNLNNPSEKAEVAAEMSTLLAAMTDNFQLQAALSFLSTRLGMSEDDLRNASRRQKRRDDRMLSRQRALSSEGADSLQPYPIQNDLAALCHISMNSVEAFDWIQEQIEPLLQASEGIIGESVFRVILTKQPRPETSAAILAFLESLPREYTITLTPLFGHVNPNRTVAQVEQPLLEAQQIFQKLSIASIERQRKQKTAMLANPELNIEELKQLQEEVKELSSILKVARNI